MEKLVDSQHLKCCSQKKGVQVQILLGARKYQKGVVAQLELYFIRFTFSTFYLYLYKRSKKWQIQKEQKNRIIVNNTN